MKTSTGGEVCSFCHTPHASNPVAPLWNREDPGTYYQTYESSTLEAEVGQPTGSSRLCLSCHDGTIALTQTYNGRNLSGGTIHISPTDAGYIGTDLSDDHPISFHYDPTLATRKGQLRNPDSLPAHLPLDDSGQLQCTTCHDPHDDSVGDFLRMSNDESALCRSCHEISGWTTSVHATSTAALAGAKRDTWDNLKATTVRGAACESCHRPHSAGGRQRLLRHAAEEDNCFSCHDGAVADGNLVDEFKKVSVHPVSSTTGVHDPTETPLTMTEHVECADCHAPHKTGRPGPEGAPLVRPAMAGASGLSSTGALIREATNEYQVCYKCHSTRNMGNAVVTRVLGTDNIADEFSSTNQSYHPVESIGRNNDVPSLKQEYEETSIIYCTDCHSSDSTTVKGPHGSRHRPLLKSNYSVTDNTTEAPGSYALCYDCHNRSSILNDESFKFHSLHISDEKSPCSACHDPHGVKRNTHLINFDRDIITKTDSTGEGPTFTDLGNERGSCTLRCHNREHLNEQY